MKKILGFIILFFVIMVIPSSAQTNPSGNFGYDDFNSPLYSYGFWFTFYPNLHYTQNGYLIITPSSSSALFDYVSHTVSALDSDLAVIRIRTEIDTQTPFNGASVEICGDMSIFKETYYIISNGQAIQQHNGYDPIYPAQCESFALGGYPSNTVDLQITYRDRPNQFTVRIKPTYNIGITPTGNSKIPYFDIQCITLCGSNPTPTPSRTPIVYPTGVVRTATLYPTGIPTLTPKPPIALTPPSISTQDANCGVYECGSVNLSFPVLPPLLSPTAITVANGGLGGVTQVPLVTSVANYTPSTPIASDGGGGNDLGGYILGDGVLKPNDPNTGAPIETNLSSVLPAQNSLFIAYIKGLYDTDANYWGPFAPLVQVTLAVATLLMFILSGRFILPVAIIIIGMIRKAWGALMDLVPF